MRAWFLSDLHLKEMNERNGNILLRFLHSLDSGEREATHLFLLGDIFDFWVGDQDYFHEKFRPLVEVLESLQKKGVKILYIEGNHDVHVTPFWQRMGIPCFVEDQYVQLGSLTLRLSHGDLMNPDDTAYLKYRDFIRRWYMEKLAHRLPAREFEMIGKWASRNSRKRSQIRRRDNSEQIIKLIRDYAVKTFKENPYDILVSGHMHVRDDWQGEIGGRKFRSVNLGSWFDEPRVWCLAPKPGDGAAYESSWVTVG